MLQNSYYKELYGSVILYSLFRLRLKLSLVTPSILWLRELMKSTKALVAPSILGEENIMIQFLRYRDFDT